MKKFLLTVVLLSSIAWSSSFAQTTSDNPEGGNKFSLGLDVGIPVGNASTVYQLGGGLSLKYSYFVSKNAAFTLGAGYEIMFVDAEISAGGGQAAFSYVPIKAGVKYYLSPSVYAEGQVGVTFFAESGGGTLFTYAPAIGYNFGGGVDLALRYESWTNNGSVNQFAVRLAYSF